MGIKKSPYQSVQIYSPWRSKLRNWEEDNYIFSQWRESTLLSRFCSGSHIFCSASFCSSRQLVNVMGHFEMFENLLSDELQFNFLEWNHNDHGSFKLGRGIFFPSSTLDLGAGTMNACSNLEEGWELKVWYSSNTVHKETGSSSLVGCFLCVANQSVLSCFLLTPYTSWKIPPSDMLFCLCFFFWHRTLISGPSSMASTLHSALRRNSVYSKNKTMHVYLAAHK